MTEFNRPTEKILTHELDIVTIPQITTLYLPKFSADAIFSMDEKFNSRS